MNHQEILNWHRQDLEERLRSDQTRITLSDGEVKAVGDLSEEEFRSLSPQYKLACMELFAESAEADNGLVVLLVDGKEMLKHIDRLEESDLPALAAYREREESRRLEEAEAWSALATAWGGLRDLDRFEGREPDPDETLGDRFGLAGEEGSE